MVMESMRACLREALACGGSFGQCEVIFLRRSTAASCRTLGVLAVRRWWTSAGTTCGSRASRRICSSACRRASLSGIRNWISRRSSYCTVPPCCQRQLPPPFTLLQSHGTGGGGGQAATTRRRYPPPRRLAVTDTARAGGGVRVRCPQGDFLR